MKKKLKILFLAAEAYPLVKIGGLGDVAGSLPLALKNLSDCGLTDMEIDIRLVLPFHGAIQRRNYPLQSAARYTIPVYNRNLPVEALEMSLEGLPVYLISAPYVDPDGAVYTSDTLADGFKFALFSMAALELARQLDWCPDILHANDWHTSLAIYALHHKRESDTFFQETRTVLGVHNLPYLGVGAGPSLAAFDLPPAYNSVLPRWAQDVPLALGLLSADHIVTVSPSYAQEILTEEFSSGLHYFLLTRAARISGILNGLDTKRWDPQNDPHLVANYGVHDLSLRALNKTALQEEFNLAVDPNIPLMAIVSRMDHQKGIDLVLPALHQLSSSISTAGRSWQIIILGTGTPALEGAARQLEREYPQRARALIRYDAALSHRIYASADMLLIPSRYEPCGITQMIAMRYGCVPVACATGGLRDTIVDFNQSPENSSGFLFEQAEAPALAASLARALDCYSSPKDWHALQTRGMQRDFSWDRSAREYLALYRSLKVSPKQEIK